MYGFWAMLCFDLRCPNVGLRIFPLPWTCTMHGIVGRFWNPRTPDFREQYSKWPEISEYFLCSSWVLQIVVENKRTTYIKTITSGHSILTILSTCIDCVSNKRTERTGTQLVTFFMTSSPLMCHRIDRSMVHSYLDWHLLVSAHKVVPPWPLLCSILSEMHLHQVLLKHIQEWRNASQWVWWWIHRYMMDSTSQISPRPSRRPLTHD